MELNVKRVLKNRSENDIFMNILKDRGIEDLEEFLIPPVDNLHDFSSFKNIERAGEILLDAIKENKKILVHADVDNDGVSSGTIMVRYLKAIGCNVDWTINDRKEHGVSSKLIAKVRELKPDVLFIVDSLDTESLDGYKMIKNEGTEIIVLDHHNIENLPYDEVVTLVSSNQGYENPELSGSGVCWKFCCYVDSLLGTMESEDLVDLAMSGIVSDMVDLSEDAKENRAIVNLGLNNLTNPALRLINKGYEANSKFISFSVSPKINACNRLNENELAMNALLEDNPSKLKTLIKRMDECRTRQKDIVSHALPDLIEQLNQQKNCKVGIVVSDVIEGVNGLIANQLCSDYQKPIIVLKEKDTCYSGSARGYGIENFNAVCTSTKCCTCAGHDNAFGISIAYNKFDEFREKVEDALKDVTFEQSFTVDAEILPTDVTRGLVEAIKKFDYISGQGSPAITFKIVIEDYEVSNMSKGKHLVLKTANLECIQWNFNGDWDALEEAELFNVPITCVGTLQSSYFGGRYKNQMILQTFELNW